MKRRSIGWTLLLAGALAVAGALAGGRALQEAEAADVLICKMAALPGEGITFTLVVTNAGNTLAGGIVLTDLLPSGVLAQNITSTGVTLVDTGYLPRYVWNVSNLSPGQVGVITLSAVLSVPFASGVFTNTALGYLPGDQNVNDNTSAVTWTVPNVAPVAVDDAYFRQTNVPLVVAPSGILRNDRDANGDPLSIIRDSDPYTGTLDLQANGAFTYTSPLDFVGVVTFTYHLNDGPLDSNTAVVTLTINPTNTLPTVSSLADQVTNEDTLIGPLTFTVNDLETDPAELTVTADSSNLALVPPANIALGGSGGVGYNVTRTVTITPAANAFGSAIITLTVSDPWNFASTAFTLTVNSVNDSPTISDILDQVTNEDMPIGPLAFAIGDTETLPDSLIVSAATSNPTLAPLSNIVLGGSGVTRTVTVSPAANAFGSATITLTVSDGSLSASDALVLTVNSVNDAPTVSHISDQTTNEDTSTGPITFTIGDAETPVGSLSVTRDSSNLTLAPLSNINLGGTGVTRTVTVNPAANQFGASVITVTVSDGSLSASAAFTLTVNSVNDLPTISPHGSDSTYEDTPRGPIYYNVGDLETPAISLTMSATSSHPTLVPPGNVAFGPGSLETQRAMTITPALDQFGTTTLTITVSDGEGFASDVFLFTVYAYNDAPTVGNIPDQITNEDTPLGPLTFVISDVDTLMSSLTLYSSYSSFPVAVTFGGSGGVGYNEVTRTLTLTPALNQNGSNVITVTVYDGSLYARDAFTLTVNPVNDAPTLSHITDRTINQDTSTGVISFTVGDVDTPAASLTVSADSSNPTLVPVGNMVLGGSGVTRTVAITPALYQSGRAVITLTVSDGALSASDAFTLTVSPANVPPTLSDIPNQATNEDTPLGPISFTIGDAETPAISLTVSAQSSNWTLAMPGRDLILGGSGGVGYNGVTRTLTITPVANQFGAAIITVTVSDGLLAAYDAFTLTVNAVNDPPVAVNDTYNTNEDIPLQVAAPGVLGNDTDGDGPALTAALAGGPSHGALTLNADGSFVYTPSLNYNGADAFTYRASDGLAQSNVATVTITILLVNDPPTISPIADQTTLEDTPLSLVLAIGDDSTPVNNLSLSYSSNSAVVPWSNIAVGGSGVTRTMMLTPALNMCGPVIITLNVSDGSLQNSVAFTLTVTCVNDAPVITEGAAVTVTISEDNAPTRFALSLHASDQDSASLDWSVSVSPTHGAAWIASALNTTAVISYSPQANYFGSDAFVVQASDGSLTDTITVAVVIQPVNDAPIANGESYTTSEDIPLRVAAPGVLGNDSDIDGAPLTLRVLASPWYGSLVLNADGSFVHTPRSNSNGADRFVYEAYDGQFQAMATVTITVTPVNDAPTVENAVYNTLESTPLSVAAPEGVLLLARDMDGDSLTATLAGAPAHGALNLHADGSFIYTPTFGYYGADLFTYRASDGLALSNVGTATLYIQKVNYPPTISAPADQTIDEDVPLTLPLVIGDDDTPVNSLYLRGWSSNWALVSNFYFSPSGGVGHDVTRTVEIRPAANAYGTAIITLTVQDGDGMTADSAFTLTVNPVNDPPNTVRDGDYDPYYSIPSTSTLVVPAPGVLGNDSDVDSPWPLTATLVSAPAHGSVTLNADGSFVYTPTHPYNGLDEFTYSASDGLALSSAARVQITVYGVKIPPTISPLPDQVTPEDTPVGPLTFVVGDDKTPPELLTVRASSSNAVLLPLPQECRSFAAGCPIALGGSGITRTVTLNPAANVYGSATVTLTAQDGDVLEASTAFALTVTPVEDAPTARNWSREMDEDTPLVWNAPGVLYGAVDAEGDPFTATLGTAPAHGQVTLRGDGSLVYTPSANYNGADWFTYRAVESNAGGSLASAPATVTVNIKPVNDPPTAIDDRGSIRNYGLVPIEIYPLLNDYDVDGDNLIVAASTQPAHGSVYVHAALIRYTPAPGYSGTDSFVYTLRENKYQNSLYSTATVFLTIIPGNRAPVAAADVVTTTEDTPVAFDVLVNDRNADGDLLHVSRFTQPAHGVIALGADNKLVYTPRANFNGTDQFIYTVEDTNRSWNQYAEVTATVTLMVAPVNDPPVAASDAFTTPQNTTFNLLALGNDLDVDGDALVITGVSQPAYGTATILAGNSIMYQPQINYVGLDRFDYTLDDGHGGSSRASAFVTVTEAARQAFRLIDDLAFTSVNAPVDISVLQNDISAEKATIDSVGGAAHGTATRHDARTVTYAPASGFSGMDVFTYTVAGDNKGSAKVTVMVSAPPGQVDAHDDAVLVWEDTPTWLDVLANDVAGGGRRLSIIYATQPAQGQVIISGTRILYTPPRDYVGLTTFTYAASDGGGGVDSAVVTVTVWPVQEPPVAVDDDIVMTYLQHRVSVNVLANDYDVDGDLLAIVNLTQPAHGQVWQDPEHPGRLIYACSDIVGCVAGIESWAYTINDGRGGLAQATARVRVSLLRPPVAVDDNLRLDVRFAADLDVLANDYDPDGGPLRVIEAQFCSSGAVSINSNNTVRYVYSGSRFTSMFAYDRCMYRIQDESGHTAYGRIRLTLAAGDSLPRSGPDVTIIQNGARIYGAPAFGSRAQAPADTSFTLNVLSNDMPLDERPLVIIAVGQPLHGQAVISGSDAIVYTPAPGFKGAETITYTMGYGPLQDQDQSGVGTVSVVIDPVDGLVTAADDTVYTAEDMETPVDVRWNDASRLGPLTIAGVERGRGYVWVNDDQTIQYLPPPDFYGEDVFTYTVYAAQGDQVGMDTAQVKVYVSQVIDPATPQDGVITTTEDVPVTFNLLDFIANPDGAPVSVIEVISGAHGQTTPKLNSTVTFQPDPDYSGTDRVI